MFNLRTLSIVSMIAFQPIVSVASARNPNTLDWATVNVTLEKSEITMHEPVILDIEITNRSTTTVAFDPGYDNENIDLNVVAPDGTTHSLARTPRQNGLKFSNAIHVEPGQTGTVSLALARWFNFDAQGKYQITLTILSKAGGDRGFTKSLQRSFTVDVLPANEAELIAECSDLLARINESKSFATSLVAAQSLESIQDPAVVPFLAKAMARKEFASGMISALVRLKTESAISALKAATKSPDVETSGMAQSALSSLSKR